MRHWALQLSLATLFYIVTACAVLVWLTNSFGFIVVAGIFIGLVVSIPCGAILGLSRGNVRPALLAGISGGMIGVAVYVGTVISRAYGFGEMERLRGYPLEAFFINLPFLLRFIGAAFAGAFPLASVGAVYNRDGIQVIAFPSLACGGIVFLGGLIFVGFDVWTRGRFPQPPLPWPIAYAISISCAVVCAAGVGLATGISWLVVRSAYRHLTKYSRASSVGSNQRSNQRGQA